MRVGVGKRLETMLVCNSSAHIWKLYHSWFAENLHQKGNLMIWLVAFPNHIYLTKRYHNHPFLPFYFPAYSHLPTPPPFSKNKSYHFIPLLKITWLLWTAFTMVYKALQNLPYLTSDLSSYYSLRVLTSWNSKTHVPQQDFRRCHSLSLTFT